MAGFVENRELDGFAPATAADGSPAVIAAAVPNGDEQVLLAVLIQDSAVGVYEQRATPGGVLADVHRIRPLASGVTLENVSVLSLDRSRPRSNGFIVLLNRDGRTEELYVVATGSDVYTVRMPLSTASRTVIRDLTGDGTAELVQYSRIFEANGHREVIVDSFVWDGNAFAHDRSLSILRRINARLRQLQSQLAVASPQDRRYDVPLRGQDDAPAASAVFPAVEVRVPVIPELLVELGASEWTLNHELALFDASQRPFVYRVQIHVVANPYAERAVSIVGLD